MLVITFYFIMCGGVSTESDRKRAEVHVDYRQTKRSDVPLCRALSCPPGDQTRHHPAAAADVHNRVSAHAIVSLPTSLQTNGAF